MSLTTHINCTVYHNIIRNVAMYVFMLIDFARILGKGRHAFINIHAL